MERLSEADGMAQLVERWLHAFGPGTATDIKWWLGSTAGAVHRALADLHAVEVDLDGRIGYLLPAPRETIRRAVVALLPPLDPTTMGWFERDCTSAPTKRSCSTRAATPSPPCGGTSECRQLMPKRQRRRCPAVARGRQLRRAPRHRDRSGAPDRLVCPEPCAAAVPLTAIKDCRTGRDQ